MADVACGTGHALVVLARAFPASTFTGYDLDEHAIARARAEAAGAGLTNVSFEVADAARLAVAAPFDVVFVFDALHDQVEPDAVLARDPRRAGARRACCSCGNRTPPTRSRTTSPTRWRRSSTRSARCTA